MKRKTSKQYTETFRKEAVNLVLEQGYTVAQAAKALDIPTKLLYSWRKRYEKDIQPSALSLTERQELIVLRKENKLLKMEKEILKNCLHFAISPI